MLNIGDIVTVYSETARPRFGAVARLWPAAEDTEGDDSICVLVYGDVCLVAGRQERRGGAAAGCPERTELYLITAKGMGWALQNCFQRI